jgi:hypothetical protein
VEVVVLLQRAVLRRLQHLFPLLLVALEAQRLSLLRSTVVQM